MDVKEIADSLKQLAGYLCISIEDAWENHTDDDIKKDISFEEIKAELGKDEN